MERSGAEWSGVERSGAGRRSDLSGRDTKKHEQRSYYKSIKGQSLEFIIAAYLGLELPHPIMSKLWGLGDQTYRQTGPSGMFHRPLVRYLKLEIMTWLCFKMFTSYLVKIATQSS